jgi:hypothetical protein
MTDLPTLKLKALVNFPATAIGGAGIEIEKTNGQFVVDLAFSDFAPPVGAIPDAANQNVLLWDKLSGVYTLAPISLFGGGGGVPEAPNDGTQYGRQSLGWSPVVAGGTPSNGTPIMDGVGAAGVLLSYSRGDHVHPSDTTRQAADTDLTAIAALSGTGIARRTSTTPTWTTGTAVVNAELATMAAYTFKGNNSSGTATPADIDIAGLTTKASPAGGDFLLLSDQAASGAWKKISISTLPGASGGITEAPNDGQMYGRQSLGWAVVVGGGATPSNALPVVDGSANAGTSLLYSRGDHVHPSDTSRAPLASPVFTGDPQVPTATAGDNDNSAASTAFVTAAISTSNGISRVVTAAGSVAVAANDRVVAINKTTGAATPVTLPAAASKNGPVLIADFKRDAGTNNITITPNGAELIQGLSSYTIAANGASLLLWPLAGVGWAL